MRRLTRAERGATAVTLAVLAVPLLGLGALVVDAGALYQERRELQNGADAAALALARDCAAGACAAAGVTAAALADANAGDGAARVEQACGAGAAGLPACAQPPPPGLAGAGWARVATATRAPGGLTRVTYRLAQLLTGEAGATVRAQATAAWGSAGSLVTTQLTISRCEYDAFVDPDGDGVPSFAGGPPFTATPRTVFFHTTADAGTCPAGPSGADLPGGFGWLESVACGARIGAGNWVPDKTGNAVPAGCDPSAWRDKVILLPVYDATNGLSGSKGSYHVAGFAAFHVAGYRFPSEKWPSNVTCRPGEPGSSTTCLIGHFTTWLTSADSFGGGAFGVTAVRLVA